MHEVLQEWKELADRTEGIVAITGAGISVASGLPTINRKWRDVSLKEVFTTEMFRRNPRRFYQCYREMLLDWREARPNAGHTALARAGVRVITQNIDGLHLAAGSEEVLEVHGNLRELACLGCEALYPAHVAKTNSLPSCPSCGALLKPNIVLVGEPVRHLAVAADWVSQAKLLLIVGTKLEMAPVCNLPIIAREHGASVLTCNEDAEVVLPSLFS